MQTPSAGLDGNSGTGRVATGSARLIFNGLNGATGEYLRPPLEVPQLADLSRGAPHPRLGWRGQIAGEDSRDLARAGWGVVFPEEAGDELRQALSSLLDHRRHQARRRYRELTYRFPESALAFTLRHGAAPGPVDPTLLPYYLLLVGGPEAIPYEVQYELDVAYAVGRISFDEPDDYRRYAEGVVAAETMPSPRRRALALFGPRHEGDEPTRLSCEQMIAPLAARLADRAGWRVTPVTGEAATKERLASLLGGSEAPALLFTAGHGLGFAPDDRRQREGQGALLCHGWPGPGAPEDERGPRPEHVFSAADVGEGALDLRGLISFHFACHSAGTPTLDSFCPVFDDGPRVLAKRDLVARLPQRLLSHPGGGALAVIGHVDATWQTSFLWEGAGSQVQCFLGLLRGLMDGSPVGAAMEAFGQRYAELAIHRAGLLSPASTMAPDRVQEVLSLAYLDSRSWVVLGDPAGRLPASLAAEPIRIRGSALGS